MKTFIFSLLLLSFGLSSSAQEYRFEAGFEGGPGLTSMRGNSVLESTRESGFGFSGAFFFQRNTAGILSFRTNLAYERKGSSWSGPVTDDQGNSLGQMTAHFNYDYLTVPLLVRASFGNKIRFFVNAGPYFSYLVNQTNVFKGDQIKTVKQDETFLYKRYDIGITTGAGVAVPVGTKLSINFEVRNNLGLFDISVFPTPHYAPIKHNSTHFLFGVGYTLK